MALRCSMLLTLVLAAGCQSWSPSSSAGDPLTPTLPGETVVRSGLAKTGRFLTGKEQLDQDQAKQWYREADQLFRTASELPREDARGTFVKAAKRFLKAAEAAPGPALQQDALYMAGESYFFADELQDAENAYKTLQNDHPRSRHSERVSNRVFAIGKYWIDAGIAREGSVMPVNFSDSSRPWIDTGGHGIRVLDQLRYDDPTGKLADDATMATAVEYMRQENWFEADQLFNDLRDVFSDSEHQFNAHKFGVRCKLEMYAGPSYSGLALDEAEKLIERSRRLFPQELAKPENREFFDNAENIVVFKQAEKLWKRALYREKQGIYGGAQEYLQQILNKYPTTPFADDAREHLQRNAEKPPTPPQRLSFLAKLFPDGQPQKPLVGADGSLLR